LELLQLKYFCKIAEQGNISNVAKELLISQPSLSKSIKKLEEELGTPLFDRKPGKIILNESGKIFYAQIKQGLSYIDDGIHQVKEMNSPNHYVRLLACAMTGSLASLTSSFQEKFPQINLSVERLQHVLQKPTADYDLVLSELPQVRPHFNQLKILDEKLGLGVAQEHPLAKFKSIYISQAKSFDFIAYPKGRNTRTHLDKFCNAAGFKPNIVSEIDHISMYLPLLKRGISLISFGSYYYTYRERLTFVPLNDEGSMREICISWPERKKLSYAAKCLQEHCITFYQTLAEKQADFLK